jgi:hypothetical protein
LKFRRQASADVRGYNNKQTHLPLLAARPTCAPGGLSRALSTPAKRERDIHGETARAYAALDEQRALVCDLICRATGRIVKGVLKTVRAVGEPPALATTLGTEPGAHALEFIRQYYDRSNTLFGVAVSLHPTDRFSYSTVLQRQSDQRP